MDPNDAKQHILFIDSKLPDEARSHKEDWSGLSDPARRRKIQNRLHQRAWRMHIAYAFLSYLTDTKLQADGRPKRVANQPYPSSKNQINLLKQPPVLMKPQVRMMLG
jgi:hypothetical protein